MTPNRSVPFPSSDEVSLLGFEVGSDGIPRVTVETIVAEGRRQQTIGAGGSRGALVHLVDKKVCRYRVYKEYVPPRYVSTNEISFMAACYQNLTENNGPLDVAQATFDTHLVIPDALVVEGDLGRGVLMPLLHGNIFQLLAAVLPPTDLPDTAASLHEDSSYHTHRCFAPLNDPTVIAAILYQLVQAVVRLNYGLPHSDGVHQFSGFSHNDLHLANLLVHYDTGAVVLCDFELVEHLPPVPGIDPPSDRVPCRSRHPPYGLWKETSDVWGLGLIAVDLLTGVVPIVNADKAFDDFGDGPLLQLPSDSMGLPVVDWDSNLAEHVAALRGVPVGACRATDELYDFCRTCLTNNEATEEGNKWAHSTDLLRLSCFQPFANNELDARAVVKSFFDAHANTRPVVVLGCSNQLKNSMVLTAVEA